MASIGIVEILFLSLAGTNLNVFTIAGGRRSSRSLNFSLSKYVGVFIDVGYHIPKYPTPCSPLLRTEKNETATLDRLSMLVIHVFALTARPIFRT